MDEPHENILERALPRVQVLELDPDVGHPPQERGHAGRLGAAVEYAMALGLDAIWERVHGLAARLRAGLAAIPGVVVHDRGEVLCGIVTFTIGDLDPEAIKQALRQRRDRRGTRQGGSGTATARPINVSTSTFRGALHDFVDRPVQAWVRSSVHYYNSEEELDEFLTAVEALART